MRIAPRLKRSERASAALPRTCSGEINATVPGTTSAWVCEASVGESALAKSVLTDRELCRTEVEDFYPPYKLQRARPRMADIRCIFFKPLVNRCNQGYPTSN